MLLLNLFLLASLCFEMGTNEAPWEKNYRLPKDVVPLTYDLILQPDLEEGLFHGIVTIAVAITATRDFLVVHHKLLKVTQTVLVTGDTGRILSLSDCIDYVPNEFWVVRPCVPILPGAYNLTLHFHGNLTPNIVGFYRSRYRSADGSFRPIATSKFQPTYARQAFPCFDEPSFKSRFTVHLVRPSEGYMALSNMDVESEDPDQPATGLTTVHFRESVPMVTYLACFIVSDFKRLPPITISPGDFEFSVYATPTQVNKTEYALHTGAAITEYYISYFKLAYPLPKLDMIAIPDFVSGAMEHWGLVTFRETNLLYDQDISSVGNKQRVASVVAHELAHMWFGNLVTLKWWDDLWLNEGFASYMEFKGVDSRHPDWAMMDQFLVDDLHPVLRLDAALSSHPIVQHVAHPDEITELFDTISYNKGASIIRMLEGFMGVERFQKGISSFLQAFQFSNAVTQDLWDALQKVVDETPGEHINITRVMDTWTRQMGFPVLKVSKDSEGNHVISQSRFLENQNANVTGDRSPFGYVWDVPITYVTSESSEKKTVWLHMDQPSVTIPRTHNAKWVKFNHHQVGYYRVNYEEEDWKEFSELLQRNVTALDVADRANLVEDAFSLADAGLLKYEVALQMTQYLKQETEYVPWNVAYSKMVHLKNLLIGTTAYVNLRGYVQNMVKDAYDSVTWDVKETDSHLKCQLRSVVLGLACSMGLEKCLQEAKAEFLKWLSNPNIRPHPDIRSLVYHYGMAVTSNEQKWNTMWKLYLAEEDAQERSKLLEGLAAARSDPWLLKQLIEYAKIESNVRSQDFFSVLIYIGNNPVGNPIVWEFVRSEWKYLVERFTLNSRYLGHLIPSITKDFSTELKLQEMKTFFEQYPDAGAGKTARIQALEKVSNNILWRQKHLATVAKWLSLHNPSN